VVGLDLPIGEKVIEVGTIFKNGTTIKDTYSGKIAIVNDGKIKLNTNFNIVLLENKYKIHIELRHKVHYFS